MRVSMPRSRLAGLAAVVLLAFGSPTAPASAATWHGGGGGGWHGGGWNGGWRGGWGYGGWRGGWGYGGWGCCGWGYPWGWGYAGWGYPGGWGYGGWDYPPDYYAGAGYNGGGSGCWTYRKVWTQPGGRGRYLGRRLVNLCQ